MTNTKMQTQVVTVQFTKGGAALLSYAQVLANQDPEATLEYRWLFTTRQFAAQNGLELPEGAPEEYIAETEEERDTLAEKLLDAVLAGRAKADELKIQVSDALGNALPAPSQAEA